MAQKYNCLGSLGPCAMAIVNNKKPPKQDRNVGILQAL